MQFKNCGTNRSRRVLSACLGLASLATLGMLACNVQVGPGGISASLTLGGTTITLSLGQVGEFVVQPNTTIRNVGDTQPFTKRPEDNPTSGTMSLRSSSITVNPAPGAGKAIVTQQSALTGVARIRVVMAEAGAVSPCDTGIDVGTFDVFVQNGQVIDVSDDLNLSLGAISFFLANNMSICVEATSNFPASIDISGLDVTFGPSNGLLQGTFELSNTSNENVEIIGPGEVAGTTLLLGPGQNRESTYLNLAAGDMLTFYVVRDGLIIDSVTCPFIDRDRYIGLVVWSGSNLECIQVLPAPRPALPPEGELPPELELDPDIEACCYDDPNGPMGAMICEELEFDICLAIGGTALGVGTRCDIASCDVSACCFSDPADCFDLSPGDCELFGGEIQPYGVFCESDPCEADDEACCLPDGTCLDGPPTACTFAGGVTRGPGTNCAEGWCTGACCDVNFACTQRTQQQCEDMAGNYRGERTPCQADTCESTACCLPFIDAYSCFLRDPVDCLIEGGFDLGTTSCPDVCPIGACCSDDGSTCDVTADFDCFGTYLGDGTGCGGLDGNECPLEGACCKSDGSCQDLPALECSNQGGTLYEGSCSTPDICPNVPTVGTLTGQVFDSSTLDPIVGALIRVDRSPSPIFVYTRGDGTYSLPFPDLPDYFAMTASEIGYVPKAVSVNKTNAVSNPQPINFALVPIGNDAVIIEAIPDVHHLGNNSFGGPQNSQFQKSAEGASYSETFNVEASQLPPTFGTATLRMQQKGTECGNPITINGTALNSTLSSAPFDGSFGPYEVTFNINLLQAGANTIVITSVECTTPGDIDDFEFVNAQIFLSP